MSTRNRTKERYWIKKLTELGRAINDQEIADILLVCSGFKPAALIELSYFPRSKFSRKEFHKKIGDLEKILKKLDFKYRLQINYPKKKKEVTRYSYIARNQRKLKEIIAADAEKNTRKRRLKLGVLLGYPKTAVKAFANNKTIRYRNLPSVALQKNELKFLNFRLSKNWRQELEYVQRRAQVIRKISPELYRRILNRPRRVIRKTSSL